MTHQIILNWCSQEFIFSCGTRLSQLYVLCRISST